MFRRSKLIPYKRLAANGWCGDALELLSGKWKIHIIGVLLYKGKLRFMDLTREIDSIAAKMLLKELQYLELNDLVKRTVCDTKLVTVKDEITKFGKSLEKVVIEIMDWEQKTESRCLVRIRGWYSMTIANGQL